jgi:hypothetical protein
MAYIWAFGIILALLLTAIVAWALFTPDIPEDNEPTLLGKDQYLP